MKTKIIIEPVTTGRANEFIYSLVEQVNMGATILDRYGFINCIVMYALPIEGLFMDFVRRGDQAYVRENEKTTLILTFKEVYELDKTAVQIAEEMYPDETTIPHL
jgi:hypothetical protein